MHENYYNNLTGDEHNFSHKSGVIEYRFYMPHGIKTEMTEEQFYNHIENNSHASTNIIAYSSIVALPPEIIKRRTSKSCRRILQYIHRTIRHIVLVLRYMKLII